MGLLDYFNSDDGQLALGLLAAAGPSAQPMSFGQRVQGAFQGARANKMAQDEFKMKQQLQQAQMADIQQQAELRRQQALKMGQMQDILGQVLGGQGAPSQYGAGGSGINLGGVSEQMKPQPGGLAGATPEQIAMLKANGVDLSGLWETTKFGKEMQPGYRRNVDGTIDYMGDPSKGLTVKNGQVSLMPGAAESNALMAGASAGATTSAQEAAKAPYSLVDQVGPNGATYKVPLSAVLKQFSGQPSQPPQSLADVMRANGDTSAQYNIGGQQGTMNLGGGAPGLKTGLSTAEKVSMGMDETMARKMADAIETSSQKTESAQATLKNLQPMYAALDSGKIMVGPGSSARTYMAQVGNVLFGSGAQSLEQTRALIQGLAKQTLESRSAFKGQGAVSNYEAQTAEKAASGDIDKMTAPEIKVIMDAAKRVAELQVQQHATLMQRADSNDWRTFFSQQGTPAANAASASPAPAVPRGAPQPGAVVRGYRFKGGDPSSPQSWEKM